MNEFIANIILIVSALIVLGILMWGVITMGRVASTINQKVI